MSRDVSEGAVIHLVEGSVVADGKARTATNWEFPSLITLFFFFQHETGHVCVHTPFTFNTALLLVKHTSANFANTYPPGLEIK